MKSIYLLVLAALYNVAALAQGEGGGSSVNVTKTTTTTTDGGFSWMWIVGILVFIVLLVALIGGRSGSNTVVKKTVVER